MKGFHSLAIRNGEVSLDGLKLLNVTGYELKRMAEKPVAELTVKLLVATDLDVVLDKAADNLCSDFGQNLEG